MTNRLYTISTGRSRLDTSWKTTAVSWEDLCGRLSRTHRTAESCAEFRAMTKDAKGKVKDIGGFVGGELSDGHRKATTVVSRSLVTLDIDYGASDTVALVRDTLIGYAWALYSTHSHTDLTPRYRVIIPLDRDATPEEYTPIARHIADTIGIDLFDDSTYQPERLMYWPSTPADGTYVFESGDGAPTSVETCLGRYVDWRNATEWPVSSRITKAVTGRGRTQEDPTRKDGVIGDFCRAYGIAAAMDTFLPGVYEPTTEGRYTYVKGSTSNGVVSYEDKWIYSHHGTDPCGGQLCNAFDMVRLHLYGALDDEAAPGTPANRMPSFTRMTELAQGDERCRYEAAKAAFGGAVQPRTPSGASEGSEGPAEAEDDRSWMAELETVKRNGFKTVLATPTNLCLLLENLPEFRGLLADDEFSCSRIILGDLPWRKRSSGIYWTDCDDLGLVEYLNRKPWRVLGKSAIIDAARLVSSYHSFHPVRDYLENLPEWDGVPRAETLLIDYLGADDTPLTRAVTRKTLAAAVRRIYEPGCKFDQVLTLVGPQGIGKSTLLANLVPVRSWFSDTPVRVDGPTSQVGLQVQATWIFEMGELTDYKKSSGEAYKNFIGAQEDKFRMPYDRTFIQKPRQFILTATTNDPYFLKGEEGNRRFWVVSCGSVGRLDVWKGLPRVRDQIWAEVLTYYKDEDLRLTGEMEEEMLGSQACHNELADDLRVDAIISYMSREVPVDWSAYTLQERDAFLRFGNIRPFGSTELVARPWAGYEEIARECLNMKLDPYAKKKIKALIREAGLVCIGTRKDAAYGSQKRWATESTTELPPNEKVVEKLTTETTKFTESGQESGGDNSQDYSDVW